MKTGLFIAFSIVALFFIFAAMSTEISADTEGNDETASDEAMADLEMGGTISGEVVRADPVSRHLIIRDSNDDTNLITIATNSATTYFGTESLKTLSPGDYVSIDYASVRDNYVAQNIVLEEKAEGEESKPPALQKVLSD